MRPSERWGSSIARIGDIDADKVDDYLIGAPSNAFYGAADFGEAQVVSGSTGQMLRKHTGSAPYDYFGSQVSRLEDLDGDAVDDYAVTASRIFVGSGLASVYVYSGKSGSLLFEIKTTAALADTSFGQSLHGGGDLDGDGTPDILVGAPAASRVIQSQNVQTGMAFAFSGKTGNKIREFPGDGSGDLFGYDLMGLEDLDNDGVPEVLVAAPQSRAGKAGYVRIFSGKTGVVLHTIAGDANADHFALCVERIADLDGDNRMDFIVGAPQTDSLPVGNGGYVRAFGSVTGKALWTLKASQQGVGFGHALAALGDVDGDGYSDIAASSYVAVFPSAPGQVRILSGKTGAALHAFSGTSKTSHFGKVLAPAGDFDGDGRPDVLVGIPLHGQAPSIEIGSVRVISSWPLSLTADRPTISVVQGGQQKLDLDAGLLRAGKIYVVAGSQAGIFPGLKLGAHSLPLNPDPYMGLLLGAPNSIIQGSVGILDSNGKATASFQLAKSNNLSLIGLEFDHAFVVFGATLPSIVWTSNPVALTLIR